MNNYLYGSMAAEQYLDINIQSQRPKFQSNKRKIVKIQQKVIANLGINISVFCQWRTGCGYLVEHHD
jgi:hypothetical protein